jgi:hypothetical protein
MSASGYEGLITQEKTKLATLITKIKGGSTVFVPEDCILSREEMPAGLSREQKALDGVLDPSGFNAFHHACQFGNVVAMRFLLSRRADFLNVFTASGLSPLEIAIASGHSESAMMCLQNPDLGKTGDFEASFQRAFYSAIQQEAKGRVGSRVVNNFYDQLRADRNLARILGSGKYVIENAEFLEKVSATRLAEFLDLLLLQQTMTTSFNNLDIRISKPKAIHKERLLAAIEKISVADKKTALERLIYRPDLPDPGLKGNASFEAFLWKPRWFSACKRTAGALKKLGERSGLASAHSKRTVAVVMGGSAVGGGTAGAGSGGRKTVEVMMTELNELPEAGSN